MIFIYIHDMYNVHYKIYQKKSISFIMLLESNVWFISISLFFDKIGSDIRNRERER